MPEDIKKIIVVIVPSGQGFDGWDRWARREPGFKNCSLRER